MTHKTPRNCGCCKPCFGCYTDNWYGRCCRWISSHNTLAEYLNGTILSFGPFAYSEFYKMWFTDAVSIPGTYDDVSTQYVYGGSSTVYNGTVRTKFRLSNIKIRLKMQNQYYWADDCKRYISYEVKWDQQFVEFTDINIVANYNNGQNTALITTSNSLKRFDNALLDLAGLTYSVDWLFALQYPTTTIIDGRTYLGQISYSYTGDCDFVHKRSEALVAHWYTSLGNWPASGLSTYYPVSLPSLAPPGFPSRQSAVLETPYWLGTGVKRTYPHQPTYSLDLTLDPDVPPFEIKRGSSWPSPCNVEDVGGGPE